MTARGHEGQAQGDAGIQSVRDSLDALAALTTVLVANARLSAAARAMAGPRVAVESVGASFFDIAPAELVYVKLAAQRGLGRMDWEKLRVEKRTV